MVLAIEATTQRGEWFQIPDLLKPCQELLHATRRGYIEPARDAFAVFKRIARTSPELLRTDAEQLIAKVDRDVFDPAVASTTTTGGELRLPLLRYIDLYGQ